MEVIQNKKQDDLKTQIPRSTDSGVTPFIMARRAAI